MQYVLDEYEYNELKNGADKITESLYDEINYLQEELENKDREIARLTAQLKEYRNKFGLLEEETDWEKTKKARCSGRFNF